MCELLALSYAAKVACDSVEVSGDSVEVSGDSVEVSGEAFLFIAISAAARS
jgi:hypothetical protein